MNPSRRSDDDSSSSDTEAVANDDARLSQRALLLHATADSEKQQQEEEEEQEEAGWVGETLSKGAEAVVSGVKSAARASKPLRREADGRIVPDGDGLLNLVSCMLMLGVLRGSHLMGNVACVSWVAWVTHRRTAVIGGQQSSEGLRLDGGSPSYSSGLPLYMTIPPGAPSVLSNYTAPIGHDGFLQSGSFQKHVSRSPETFDLNLACTAVALKAACKLKI